jgi:hypothetical protein
LPNAGIFPIILAIHLLGCSSSPSRQPVSQTVGTEVAPGVILTDVLEGGQPPQHYWQYEVRPAAGSVRMVKEEEIQNIYARHIPETFQWPTGAIEACAKRPEANSPDGKYVARSTVLPMSYISTFAVPLFLILHIICIVQARRWPATGLAATGNRFQTPMPQGQE